MNDAELNELSFKAHYIDSFEINRDTCSNCKLRSKFVHEKIFESRIKDAIYSVNLLISERGVKVINPLDQVVLSSHSIQRISYSACDRHNRLFALVVRSSGVTKGQLCYIFRMDTSEQADSVNRYFGSIFKQLHNEKKEKKCQQALLALETAPAIYEKYENVSELFSSLELTNSGIVVDTAKDSRLRQISTSNISELVFEKHNIRRLSLSMPPTDTDDAVLGVSSQPYNSLVENPDNSITNNLTRPIVRRRKPESKGNRISAAIERWSFRSSREMSSDYLKSGSPVVALKEQLEYEDLFSADSSIGSEPRQERLSNPDGVPQYHTKKPLLILPTNLSINNDSKANNNVGPKFVRKNSAPICKQINDEQPPVPPVRIHSLRITTGSKTLNTIDGSQHVRSCGEGASQSIPGCYDDDDDLSSITTPSSCDQAAPGDVKLSVYNEPPAPSKIIREPTNIHPNYNYPSKDNFSSQSPIGANTCQTSSSTVPIQYFRNFNKEEAMFYLVEKEIGVFLLRFSASHQGCLALSVKVADNVVSHYIIQQTTIGLQMKGLDKTWPNIQSLITHLSVIPEILPCPLRISPSSSSQLHNDRRPSAPITYFTTDLTRDVLPPSKYNCRQKLPQSQSADIEYQQRMKHFLRDISTQPSTTMPATTTNAVTTGAHTTHTHDQYQQLSDFSSIIASLDFV